MRLSTLVPRYRPQGSLGTEHMAFPGLRALGVRGWMGGVAHFPGTLYTDGCPIQTGKLPDYHLRQSCSNVGPPPGPRCSPCAILEKPQLP